MASLQKKGNGWYCQFLHHGKRHTFAVGAVTEEEAQAKSAQVDYLLLRLKQKLIELPAGVGIVDFLQRDGKPPTHAAPLAGPGPLTLTDFRDRYLATHRASLEARTTEGIELHFKHMVAAFGERFPIRELSLSDLQGYVDARVKAKGLGGKRLSPATVRKEIVTLRTAWNWAERMGLVSGRFPYAGLRYPKTDDKPPFQTMEEIERQIAAGHLTPTQRRELWEALYLQAGEVADMLAHARADALHPWIYPLICMAAHTGARRSELIRMLVTDVDFSAQVVTIREKKRVKGRRSTRRAPMTPRLAEAIKAWLAVHPGGNTLFCHDGRIERSKKRSPTTGHVGDARRATTKKGRLTGVRQRDEPAGIGPLTTSELHDHFKRTLAGSKWAAVRGLHVLRHSCASCLAAAGVDQRIIDDILGHQSEEMRRRYRHLTPQIKQQAVISVFS